jgi:threonine/homoserine/homoserine lactone efflux protein
MLQCAVFSETLRRGLTGGFRPALLVQLGSLIGDAVWALIGLTGLVLLLAQDSVRVPLTIACAAYLVWLGVKLFRNCLGEASVGVNDILDQNGTTFRRTVSGTTLRNVTNLAVGRYVSFQFTYNLRLFRRQSNAVMDALQGK